MAGALVVGDGAVEPDADSFFFCVCELKLERLLFLVSRLRLPMTGVGRLNEPPCDCFSPMQSASMSKPASPESFSDSARPDKLVISLVKPAPWKTKRRVLVLGLQSNGQMLEHVIHLVQLINGKTIGTRWLLY